jgi:pimeloyl-ACP methyl ester carboxylesterase
MSQNVKPSIVFAHGIWADGSCFSKVIPPLQADGYEVASAQYGLDTNEDDVAATLRTLGRVHGPVLLVGHSYGGSVITAAGTDGRVAGLVYICALAPDETETSQGQQDKFPVTDVFAHVAIADGRAWMLPSGAACFAGDLPEEEQKLVWATHFAPAADLFLHNAPGVAWRSKPSWYIVGSNDHTVHPSWSALRPSGWAPPPMSSTAATSPCCPSLAPSSISSGPPRHQSEPAGKQ